MAEANRDLRFAARCLEARDHPTEFNRREAIIGYVLEAQMIADIRRLATPKE